MSLKKNFWAITPIITVHVFTKELSEASMSRWKFSTLITLKQEDGSRRKGVSAVINLPLFFLA